MNSNRHSPGQPWLNPGQMLAFEEALRTMGREATEAAGRPGLRHLVWLRACTWILFGTGYGLGLVWLTPFSFVALSLATFARWTMLAHHVLHGGYDKVEGAPAALTSRRFARGWRRWLDWPDWIHPDAWEVEHNLLHHYRLGETYDPDQPEHNLEPLRTSPLPIWLRYLLLPVGALVWKPLYYAPNTMLEYYRRQHPDASAPHTILDLRVWLPWHPIGALVWRKCWLPYAAYLGALVLPAFVIPGARWEMIAANLVLAELLTNLHAFIVIVPNHAGDDIYRFEGKPQGRAEFYLRQIAGTANYRTGGPLRDYLHGFLNYQIEHHLWPDLTMHQYRTLQPKVQRLCEDYGLPYVQESVWQRLAKLAHVVVGSASMPCHGASTRAGELAKGSAKSGRLLEAS